ncbi:MAG: sodium-translocating pyrophosphatase, partial [archaeon]
MLLFVFIMAVIALLFTLFLNYRISKENPGNDKMQEIASHIREGAMSFLKKEYQAIAVFVVIMFIVLFLVINSFTAVAFVIGAITSALAGFIGMKTATKANSRTTQAARSGLDKALKIAFSSGAMLGLSVVGLGLIGITGLYYVLTTFFGYTDPTTIIFGFGFGASSIALFARVGGGIYTKAADVGADLVGKVEAGIPEDDPRNPAVIADNVGDNVGDVAGMGADLFESYVGSIIAAMALGYLVIGVNGLMLPLSLAGIGIIASIIGVLFVNFWKSDKIHTALRNGTYVSSVIMIILAYFLFNYMGVQIELFYTMVLGLVAGLVIGYSTEYYTSNKRKPTQELSKTSETGAGPVIINGLALGMFSTVVPVLVIAIAIYFAFTFGGLFGIALAGVGMLSTLGITLAVDAYGPVADNAGGIAEMAGLPKEVRQRTDALDEAGNTTAAIGKGFAIGSAALTALALFSAFITAANLTVVNLVDVNVVVGLFIGGIMPFLFASFAMSAVGKAASEMVTEVRRQFKEIKGLMQGKAKPDYKRCVEISTSAAIKRMILPGALAIIVPIVVGLVLGAAAVAGLLAGALVTGVLLAIMMANAGGAWDNAKKFIEEGNFGGKGSAAHKAAVVGDTVGDPFKDTAGPSLNILIKLMSII